MQPKQMMLQLWHMIDQKRPHEVAKAILNYPRGKELVSVVDIEGKNVFFRAIQIPDQGECIRVLQHLVKQGGNIRHHDKNNQSIVYFAAKDQKEEVIKYLLTFDFNLNTDDFFSQTPLFYSARNNSRCGVAAALLRAGCDVNHKDNNGQTCLFYAAAAGNLEMCRLFVDYGVNVQLVDFNRDRAINYARKNGTTRLLDHPHVIEYLNNCKMEVRKVKEQRRQDSSQNTTQRRKKKEVTRNEYCLVFTNQNGETKVLTPQELQIFKKTSEDYAKLYQLMVDPDEPVEGLAPAPDKRFERLATKILSHFWKLENSYHFYEPVNYLGLGLHDYPTIVKYPMDFGTIKRKLSCNAYDNEFQFQADMNLVFDNCILYNGTERDIGKIALQMKMEFNTMFLKDFSI